MATEASPNTYTSTQIQPKNNSNGILKFINQSNSKTRPQGKKCNPYRQFGVSSDAPAQFCTKNCLIADMASFKQKKAKLGAEPELYSQKNFFTIGHSSNKMLKQDKNNFVKQYSESCLNNKIAFHRTSSKISKFYQRNAWMGDRFYVMGHERSEKALQIAKTNVQINTHSARSLNFSRKRSSTAFTSARTVRLYPTHQDMKQTIMSEKNKIREMRNMLAKPQQQYQEEVKRPHTSFSNSKYQASRLKLESNGKTKQRQFEIYLPEWGEKQFNVKFIDWNPQRNSEREARKANNENQKQLLGASSKLASRFFSQHGFQ